MVLRGFESLPLRSMIRPLLMALVASAAAALVIGCGDDNGEEATTTAGDADSAGAPAAVLGVTLVSSAEGGEGVLVQSVQERATRLREGDEITAVNGAPVTSVDDAIHAIGDPQLGDRVTLDVTRGSHDFPMVIVPSPATYLGANVFDAPGNREGAVVKSLSPQSPAAASDMRRGDVIVALDGTPIASVDDLLEAIGTHDVGDRVRIEVSRGSGRLDMTATLAARPGNAPAN